MSLVGNAQNFNAGSSAVSVTHGLTIQANDIVLAFLDINVDGCNRRIEVE